MPAHTEEPDAFPPAYLANLRKRILACRWLATNTLNRDFVGTRGFSVVFRRSALERVTREFPFFAEYLGKAMRPDCNAFYMNPLLLEAGSRVDPHIDRSLCGYCPAVNPPVQVSVLYVSVPPGMRGGRLELRRGRSFLARVVPAENTLVRFEGDLMHSVERVETPGTRISLVCENYALDDDEMAQVPEFTVESRARY